MLLFRRSHATPDLRPGLEIEVRARIEMRAEIERLRDMLYARDADVMRLQRENDELKLGTLGRLTAMNQRRDAERLRGRNARGEFAGKAA